MQPKPTNVSRIAVGGKVNSKINNLVGEPSKENGNTVSASQKSERQIDPAAKPRFNNLRNSTPSGAPTGVGQKVDVYTQICILHRLNV